ncbi:MAG TPA: DUF29 domain-containing protein [Gammaproteobacteria bacterium]|nr:DUF29 domain-containing protein [Gammaproteobacteria bacterium]
MTTYQSDFYLWTQQQANLLRQGALSALDVENLIEEVDDMGASRARELESRLSVLLAHLLKWIVQPERRGNSWRLTIKEQRRRVHRLLEKNPSLRPHLLETIDDVYGDAVLIAAREMNKEESEIPDECPFTVEQITGDWWPE